MKSHLFLIVVGLFLQTNVFGQIQSVTLQASGLTCSMCSRAIYKSLQKVPSVAAIREDIEHSSYHILFKDPANVSLENLKKAVTDAGFSVASMEVNASFHQTDVASDSLLKVNDLNFYFVDTHAQQLDGEKRLLILDKDFLLEKDRKKYAGSFESKTDSGNGRKIYHVTISKS